MSSLPDWLLISAIVVGVTLLLGALALAAALWWSQRRLRQALAAQASAARAEHERGVDLAVSAERTRILREMHDVIAHSLAIMIAQADGGSYVTADPEATRRALVTIAETGRSALADTRRILGVMRDGGSPALAPIPQEAGVADLVAAARDAGVDARFVRLGQPRALPSAIGLALYRICQESLTNVMKHAPSARVVVTENWLAEEVVVTVTDSGTPGRPASTGDGGSGLIGMRERAEVVGGDCEAGPFEDGFRVRAVLPAPNGDAIEEDRLD